MQEIPQEETAKFDWTAYESGKSNKKGYNTSVSMKYPDAKVFCTEPYAMEMYEMIMDCKVQVKDYENGDICLAQDIRFGDGNKVQFELANGLSLDFDMEKERKFCSLYGMEPAEFISWVKDNKDGFIKEEVYIQLNTAGNGVKGSLNKGHEFKTKRDFAEEIKNPKNAYVARVISRNKGGFIVSVLGVEAFLPGGLAAANKIIDFEDYMSKSIMVMIEDYLPDTGTFVVSNKKYVSHILPSKIAELDLSQQIEASVTGTAKYGIFLEFVVNDFTFTGLLHYSKMNSETRDRFKNREVKPSEELNVWIKEITKDDRIILSEEDPKERIQQIDDFKEKNLGLTKSGKVVSIKPFGTLVKLEKDIIGLLSKKELKTKKKFLNVGDDIIVTIDDIQKDKIYLSLINEGEKLQ